MKRFSFLSALMLIVLAILGGCSAGNHKVTEGEPCGECHADGKEEIVWDSVDAAKESLEVAFTVGSSFSIEANADAVWLCSLRFGDDAGIHAVPSRLKTLGREDLSFVQVKDSGLYALCVGNLDNPSTTIIEVDPSVSDGKVVVLG